MRIFVSALGWLLAFGVTAAAAQSAVPVPVCTMKMNEGSVVVHIKNHLYFNNWKEQATPLNKSQVGIIEPLMRQKDRILYVVVEPGNTFLEVQAVSDRLLSMVPGLRVAVLQVPVTTDPDVRCVELKRSASAPEVFMKIPMPAMPVGH